MVAKKNNAKTVEKSADALCVRLQGMPAINA